MDTELLVDNRVEDGRKLLAELAAQGFDVAIAFWVRTSEEGLWFLYIASSRIGRVSIADAYRSVYAALRPMKDASLSVSEIKLIAPDNPIAVDALAIRQRFSARMPSRYNGKRLGQLAIEEAYIYPPVTAGMDRAQVLHSVTQLMNRHGVIQPSLVTLRNGSSFQAIPLGIQVGQPGEIAVVLRNVTSGVDESLSIDEIMNIQ
jgi:hypothetical protein